MKTSNYEFKMKPLIQHSITFEINSITPLEYKLIVISFAEFVLFNYNFSKCTTEYSVWLICNKHRETSNQKQLADSLQSRGIRHSSLSVFTTEGGQRRGREVIGNSLVACCVWLNAVGHNPRPSLASLSLTGH